MKGYIIKVPLYFETLIISVHKKLPNKYEACVELKNEGIDVKITPYISASVIAHESVHIANFIFKSIQADLDIDNDEPYAYLVGWIANEIDKVKDLNNKI
jgi:hypothetical protein